MKTLLRPRTAVAALFLALASSSAMAATSEAQQEANRKAVLAFYDKGLNQKDADAALAYVGIFPSFIGYIFYNKGVAEIGANKASLFIHLMPVFGTILSTIFLGEIPHWYHYLGIGLIFTGIWLTMRK